ncbi:ATP-binding cassette domain-containing protein [Salinibacterium sp. SWN248]|uniref:ATP-binding cassette domain-containing protein n=1 Tax=Salinibacterium sp. SWN248 TaxID=2792056 RepID=UPI0018CDF1C9|nr:ATP-binding cassette domain-containing protein [Salinibacterium sp. SWN248]MBH0024329.1 ABC transporter ATP-binding protein [Salinibacterium sp. SWN248]
MTPSPLLEISDLTVRYGAGNATPAVNNVSLSLAAGETVGLVGESGSGKSTVARAVLGLMPFEGTITYQGENLAEVTPTRMRAIRSDLQMIFQDPYATLDPRMTVGRQIAEPMLVHKIVPRSGAAARVGELLEQVGLSAEMAGRYPHEFSGGQRQRIAIARALGVSPSLIVCDEPTSALDVSVQAQVLELLQELQRTQGIAYLFIAHNLGVVRAMSHRVAVMYLGEIVEYGTSDEVFSNPQHPYTRALIEAVLEPDPASRHRPLSIDPDLTSPINVMRSRA